MNAQREYDTLRARLMPKPEDPSFFVSLTARRLIYAVVCPNLVGDVVERACLAGRACPGSARTGCAATPWPPTCCATAPG